MLVEGLVSTIIPVHNRPLLLREAVASVLAQTYRPIEIIIVDDGSTDETGREAEALAEAIRRFAPSIVRTAARERRARQDVSQREANSFNISTAMISCCRQNLSSKLLVCDDREDCARLLWKNAFLLRYGDRPTDVRMEADWRAHFDDVSIVSAVALVGYIDAPLSAGGNGFGGPMDRAEERGGLGVRLPHCQQVGPLALL